MRVVYMEQQENVLGWRCGWTPAQLTEWFIETQDTLQQTQPQRKRRADNDSLLRVCTYNVHFFYAPSMKLQSNVDGIFDQIEQLEADVLVLNEFSPHSDAMALDMVSRMERLGFVHHSWLGSPSWKKVTFVTVVFSKRRLAWTKQIQLVGDRHAVVVELEDQNFCVCGVHLDVADDSGSMRNRQLAQLIPKLKELVGEKDLGMVFLLF